MADEHRAKVKQLLEKHKHALTELHEHLRAVEGANKHKLGEVLKKHDTDHAKFESDCLECWVQG